MYIIRCDERQRVTAGLCACRSTDTMDIVFGIMRHIVIDDQWNIGHIDSARYYIGSHEHINLSVSEIEHHLVPLILLKVTMHSARVYR